MSKVPPPMSYIKKTFEFIDVSLILYKQESEAATGKKKKKMMAPNLSHEQLHSQ